LGVQGRIRFFLEGGDSRADLVEKWPFGHHGHVGEAMVGRGGRTQEKPTLLESWNGERKKMSEIHRRKEMKSRKMPGGPENSQRALLRVPEGGGGVIGGKWYQKKTGKKKKRTRVIAQKKVLPMESWTRSGALKKIEKREMTGSRKN